MLYLSIKHILHMTYEYKTASKERIDLSMIRKYDKTTLFVIDSELYNWAQYRAKTLGYASVSEYIFDLIKIDREQTVLKKKPDKK